MTSDPAAKDGRGHTKGPWKAVTDTVHTLAGAQIADCSFAVKAEANARRIVACVNACEGIADPEAFIGASRGDIADRMTADNARLRERVKELESALQKIANHDGVSEIIARVALSKSPK